MRDVFGVGDAFARELGGLIAKQISEHVVHLQVHLQ